MKTIQGLFKRLSLREKAMLSALLWILVLLWITTWTDRFGARMQAYSDAGEALTLYDTIMAEEPAVNAEIRAVSAELDPSRTFSDRQLALEVDTLARRLGIRDIRMGTPRTQSSDTFDFHTLRFEANRTPLAKLIDFEKQIRERAPYISLESLRLDPLESNYKLMEGTFILRSFELKGELVQAPAAAPATES